MLFSGLKIAIAANGNRLFLNRIYVASGASLAEAHPAAVIAAFLAGKTVLAGMLFDTPDRRLRDVHLALQSANGYMGHD